MVRVQLLGRPHVLFGAEWQSLPLDRSGALLAYLAYHQDWVGRDRLSFVFWPDRTDRVARANLRQLLKRARRYAFAHQLEVAVEQLRWPVPTDVQDFRQALGDREWEAAVACYRGHLLTDLNLRGALGFEGWLELEREGLRTAWRNAVVEVAGALEEAGRHEAAATQLKLLLDDDQLVEDVLQHYLRSAYLAGQRDLALQVYERFAAQLEDELDLEPLESTLELVAALRGATPLASPASPEPGFRRIPVTVLRPPRLVGRTQEITRIREADTIVVTVAGEAGVGKSRLLNELAPEAPRLRCQEGLQKLPYYPVITLVRERARGDEARPDLGPYLEDLVRVVPEFGPDLNPGPADPETGRLRLFEALARYLEGLRPAGSGAAEFALVADDLQWADEATLDLLIFLASRGSLRILAAYRHHEAGPALGAALAALRSGRLLTQVTLEPLTLPAVTELMAQLSDVSDGPRMFSGWLHRHTGGNPMFLLETLKSLFERSLLRADSSGWHSAIDEVTQDYRELEPPPAVAEVVVRRVEDLGPETRRVLQVAAVVGRGLDPRLLSRVSGLSEHAVMDALEQAQRAAILHGDGFQHDILRQSIYRLLGSTRRERLHQRVAAALGGGAEAGVVAEHWFRGNEPDRAVPLWLEAAAEQQARGLLPQAAALYQRALEHLPEPAAAAAVRLELARAHLYAGDYPRTREVLEPLLSRPQLDVRVRAGALKTVAETHFREGNLAGAKDRLERSLGLAPDLDDEILVSELWEVQANIAFYEGDYQASARLLKRRLKVLEKRGPSGELAQTLASQGGTLDSLGKSEEALPVNRKALAMARSVGARHIEVLAASNHLSCCMNLGRTDEALADAEHALTLGHFETSDSLRNNVAVACRRLGRLEESVGHNEQLTRSSNAALATIASARLAGLHTELGRAADAAAWLDRALEKLGATDLPFARAAVAIALLEHGADDQLEAAREILDGLEPEQLPVHIRRQLEEARRERGLAS